MTDTPTFDNWLQSRHNEWNKPLSLIHEYVQKATGSTIAQANRLIIGQDNEVYDTLFHLALLRMSLWMLMVHVAHENPYGIQGFRTGIERALRYFADAN